MENHWERLKNGSNIVSNTPQDLWNAAMDYFKWCDEHPIETKETIKVGKEAGKQINVEQIRPYSIKGLCLHCNILEEYLRDIRQTKKKDSDYYIVVSKIIYIVYVQNQELATVGVFNPIFTAKVLNMDKDDTPPQAIKVEIVSGLPSLSNSESEILEKLELENGLISISKEQKRNDDTEAEMN